MAIYLTIHPDNPQERLIKQVVECLRDGGIVVYPTDTIYGLGCDIYNERAVERICALRGIKPQKANLSFVCYDLSHLSDFTLPFERWVYKLMNKNLPGPFTFILPANNKVPKIIKANRKTVGIRVPDNTIARNIVKELGNPIVSATIKSLENEEDYYTDPEEIFHDYQKLVDIVIDGGISGLEASTIVDCTEGEPVVTRQGKGELEL